MILILSLLGAGCGSGAGDLRASGKAGKDYLVFGISQEPKYLTAGRSNGQIPNILQTQMYNNLISLNEEGNCRPELEESWNVSEDGLTYTFHLREDVRFYNGEPMTAEDVAFSLDYHAGKLAEVLTGQLREIGIDASLEVLEAGAYWASLMSDYDYDIAIGNYTATTPDADIPLMQHYATGAYLNYTNHSIPELDQVLTEARGELDEEKRVELYGRAMKLILKENCLVVPVCSFSVTGAGDSRLKRVEEAPYSDWKVYQWTW